MYIHPLKGDRITTLIRTYGKEVIFISGGWRIRRVLLTKDKQWTYLTSTPSLAGRADGYDVIGRIDNGTEFRLNIGWDCLDAKEFTIVKPSRLIECFCKDTGIPIGDAFRLNTLAERAKERQERAQSANLTQYAVQASLAINEFEKVAKALGYDTKWPGLWPNLSKGDRDFIPLPLD